VFRCEREDDVSSRRIGVVLAAVGAIVLAVSALADPLGIGGADGFGWKQIVGMIVGAGVAILGVALAARARPT
jgi:hypothetical protein